MPLCAAKASASLRAPGRVVVRLQCEARGWGGGRAAEARETAEEAVLLEDPWCELFASRAAHACVAVGCARCGAGKRDYEVAVARVPAALAAVRVVAVAEGPPPGAEVVDHEGKATVLAAAVPILAKEAGEWAAEDAADAAARYEDREAGGLRAILTYACASELTRLYDFVYADSATYAALARAYAGASYARLLPTTPLDWPNGGRGEGGGAVRFGTALMRLVTRSDKSACESAAGIGEATPPMTSGACAVPAVKKQPFGRIDSNVAVAERRGKQAAVSLAEAWPETPLQKQRRAARMHKLAGDLAMLLGDPAEALSEYALCADMSRASGDGVWLGAAAESGAAAMVAALPIDATLTPEEVDEVKARLLGAAALYRARGGGALQLEAEATLRLATFEAHHAGICGAEARPAAIARLRAVEELADRHASGPDPNSALGEPTAHKKELLQPTVAAAVLAHAAEVHRLLGRPRHATLCELRAAIALRSVADGDDVAAAQAARALAACQLTCGQPVWRDVGCVAASVGRGKETDGSGEQALFDAPTDYGPLASGDNDKDGKPWGAARRALSLARLRAARRLRMPRAAWGAAAALVSGEAGEPPREADVQAAVMAALEQAAEGIGDGHHAAALSSPLPPAEVHPLEALADDLRPQRAPAARTTATSASDPFIYSAIDRHRSVAERRSEDGGVWRVAGEPFDVSISLCNPLDFDLHVDRVAIVVASTDVVLVDESDGVPALAAIDAALSDDACCACGLSLQASCWTDIVLPHTPRRPGGYAIAGVAFKCFGARFAAAVHPAKRGGEVSPSSLPLAFSVAPPLPRVEASLFMLPSPQAAAAHWASLTLQNVGAVPIAELTLKFPAALRSGCNASVTSDDLAEALPLRPGECAAVPVRVQSLSLRRNEFRRHLTARATFSAERRSSRASDGGVASGPEHQMLARVIDASCAVDCFGGASMRKSEPCTVSMSLAIAGKEDGVLAPGRALEIACQAHNASAVPRRVAFKLRVVAAARSASEDNVPLLFLGPDGVTTTLPANGEGLHVATAICLSAGHFDVQGTLLDEMGAVLTDAPPLHLEAKHICL